MLQAPGAPRARLIEVDALRGLAALIVLFHHARTLFAQLDARLADAAPDLHAVAVFVSRRNVEAVLLFFVLSGLSIGLTVEQRGLASRSALIDYYRRRGLRIVPLYLLALAVSGAVAEWLAPVPAQATSARTLLGNLFFLQTATGTAGQWFLPYAGNGALWSLSFEMFFYLGYPWLVRSTPSLLRRSLSVLVLSTLGLLWSTWAPCPPAMFCAASMIWYCGVELAQQRTHGRMGLGVRAYVVLALVGYALRFGFGWLPLHGLTVGASALLIGYALSLREARITLPPPLLRALCRIGAFSYGLYLLHVPIMRAHVAVLGQGLGSAVCAVALSLLLAWTAERQLGKLH